METLQVKVLFCNVLSPHVCVLETCNNISVNRGVACGFTHKYSGQNKYEITDK